MATSDLCEALKRHAAVSSGGAGDGSSASSGTFYPSSGYSQHSQHQPPMLDANMEKKICRAVLNLLNDSSNDVQAIAVKTLGVLLRTVHEEQVQEIAASLCTLVLDSSKSELRDVYAIGLRTLVKTVPLHMGDVVSHHLVGRLVEGIRSNSSLTSAAKADAPPDDRDRSTEEIILACLDVLNDILTRFGSTSVSITRQHDQILNTTLAQLASERPVVRKRAGNTVGCLSSVISDPLLFRLVENLLSQIDLAEGVGRSGRRRTRQAHTGGTGTSSTMGAPAVSDTRALIRTMCTVSGAVGHRLGQEQIDRIVPIFLRFCDPGKPPKIFTILYISS
jgi:cullin-associated NEDD8-dissociated protein 1